MKRIILLLTILVCIYRPSAAQTLGDFYAENKERPFVLELNYNRLNNQSNTYFNPAVGGVGKTGYKNGYAFLAFNFNKGWKTATPGDFYYAWNWRIFSDLLGLVHLYVGAEIKDDDTKIEEVVNGFLSNSFIGFHDFGFNVFGSDAFVLRTGINIGDYQYHLSSAGGDYFYARENGNYYKLGTFLESDVMIGQGMVVSLYSVFSAFNIAAYHRYNSQINQPNEFNWWGRSDNIKSPFFQYSYVELTAPSSIVFARYEMWNVYRKTDVDKAVRGSFVIGLRMTTS